LASNIRNAYRDSKIIFLTFKDNVPMLEILSLADEYLIIDTENPFVLVGSIFKTIIYCHRQKIDISMDMEFYSKFSTIMSFLSGARWRMGFYLARFWRNSLVNVPVYFNYSRHILELYGMFAQALQIENQDLYPKTAVINEEEKNALAKELSVKNISNLRKTVGLNIHASDLALCRRWPLPKFVSLVEQFLIQYGQWDIILTGVKSEKAYSQEFLSLLPSKWHSRVINLTGDLNLKQFLILLSQLPLFITNDTGPFHLAKFTGTHTISLWGPGSVDLYGPYQKEKEYHDVVYKRYPCSPCLYIYRTDAGYFCRHQAPCMQAIEPTDVMALVFKRLRN
jgi:ADP-heptose:LPS heptosyltransferase